MAEQFDRNQVEQIVNRITEEVDGLLCSDESTCSVQFGGVCRDCGLCVELAGTSVRAITDAGAARITSTLGVKDVPTETAVLIDHTLLKPDATAEQVTQLCAEARDYGFASVCVNPVYVPLCVGELGGTEVGICCVIGFPLGASMPEVKRFEAERAAACGATEMDMVINVGALKSMDYALVERDIAGVVQAGRRNGSLIKVILETALLTDEEKIKASALSKAAGADFVKTSTGFGPGGATVEDVALMRRVVGSNMGVKASGGVKDYADLKKMVKAGASRIGASAGIKIIKEAGN